MKVYSEKCTGCFSCIPYCPVGAIKKSGHTAFIDQDECVECGTCLRAQVCKFNAIFWPELTWPRLVRQAFSAVVVGYEAFGKATGHPERAGIGGRGTEEMKTNDVTARFKDGEIGIAVELGRPQVGTYFRDLEKVAKALAKKEVEFETENPVTALLDVKTGELKFPEVRNEKVLSAIIECKTKQEKAVALLKELEKISKEIDTVFSVDIINRCKDGKIPFKAELDKAGISVRINGKTCIGLGRIPK